MWVGIGHRSFQVLGTAVGKGYSLPLEERCEAKASRFYL